MKDIKGHELPEEFAKEIDRRKPLKKDIIAEAIMLLQQPTAINLVLVSILMECLTRLDSNERFLYSRHNSILD